MDVRWNLEAFREVRNLPAVQADVLRRASAIAEGCGAGFVAEPGTRSRGRARAAVIAASADARRRDAKNNVILSNVERGRHGG